MFRRAAGRRTPMPSLRLRRGRRAGVGFTLVEILTAIAVFGVIGVLATRILAGMIDVGEATRERGDALAELQRAMRIIERDIEQATLRTVRDELGDPLAPLVMSGASLLELTRLGWQNPLSDPRAELQRVAYVIRDDKLLRLFWPVLDRAPDSKPTVQLLLAGVGEVRFSAYDETGEKHGHWPLDPPNDDTPPPRLAAVEMGLGLDTHGRIDRLWLVPRGMDFEAGDAPSGGGGEPREIADPVEVTEESQSQRRRGRGSR